MFREKISGATADRPQLRKLLAVVSHGDVVIIPAVDRLSRDTTDLLVIARDLQKAGAGLRSIAEPVVDTTSDFAELVLAMLGVAAKLERRRIKERTALGRANAKARGVKFGRKPKLTDHQRKEAIKRRREGRGDDARDRAELQRLAPDDFEALSMLQTRHEWIAKLAAASNVIAAMRVDAAVKDAPLEKDAAALANCDAHCRLVTRAIEGLVTSGASTQKDARDLLNNLIGPNTYGYFAELAAYDWLMGCNVRI